jgi:hypothetical protein
MRTPKDVVSNIITLNQLLRSCDLSMFHNKTLDVMARVGVEYLCSSREKDDTALTVLELPSESDHDDDEYGDAGFFDEWSSSSDEWSEDHEQMDDETDETNNECCFMSQGDNYRMNKNTWLGDSATSTHMGFSDEGMIDVELINSPVRIGNGKALTATKIGKRQITIIQRMDLHKTLSYMNTSVYLSLWSICFQSLSPF